MRRTVGLLLLGALLVPGAVEAKRHRRARPRHADTRRAAKPSKPPSEEAVDRFARGAKRYLEGDYAAAQHALAPLAAAPEKGGALHNQDAALFFLAGSEAFSVPPAREKALTHYREVAAMQQGRYTRLAKARAADLLFELGRYGDARLAYLGVIKNGGPEIDTAVAFFRLGEMAARIDDRHRALEWYRRTFIEHPSHPIAARALDRLKALDEQFAISVAERISRAKQLTNEHAWGDALGELEHLAGEIPAALRDEVDYWIGTIHFKMRHGYDIAAQKLLGVWPRLASERQPEALFHGARAWSRADHDDQAISGYEELLAKFPRARQAPEAAYLVGWLDFNRGRYKEAIPGLERCLKRYAGSAYADEARWYLGFSRWMSGDVEGALADFDTLSRMSGALTGGKGRYWKGRALERLGRGDEAQATWQKLAADYPFTYYALQARVRLREHGVVLGPFGTPAEASKEEAAAPVEKKELRASVFAIDPKVARDSDVVRVDELLRAELPVEAGVELDRIDGYLFNRYGSGRAVPLLIDRYLKAEDFFHVHRLAEAHAGGALRQDPHLDATARRWWELVYPLAYRRFVEKYASTGSNPTYYLYTIMQKESAYNPNDLSYADAIGLLQMIPPTSRRVAERIGRPYTDDVLYDPEGNIQFGAWYIGHLLEKFKGQLALGAGSFNAGPQAMMKWLKKNGERPLDEFVELCPYTQTREYMKKVLDIYSHYVWLYEHKDYLPDEKVDSKYLENDIDY